MRYMTFYKCDATLSYVWHDFLAPGTLCANSCGAHGTWKVVVLIRVWDKVVVLIRVWDSFHAWHDSLTCLKCLFRASDTTRSCVCLDSLVCATRLLCMHDTTLSPVPHDFVVCWTWLFFMRDFSSVRHDSFVCVKRLAHIRDTTLSYVWHDSFTRLTWLVCTCDKDSCVCATWILSFVWNNSSTCVTRLFYAWHDSFVSVAWLFHTGDALFHMSDATSFYVCHDSFVYSTRLCSTCSKDLLTHRVCATQFQTARRPENTCYHGGRRHGIGAIARHVSSYWRAQENPRRGADPRHACAHFRLPTKRPWFFVRRWNLTMGEKWHISKSASGVFAQSW